MRLSTLIRLLGCFFCATTSLIGQVAIPSPDAVAPDIRTAINATSAWLGAKDPKMPPKKDVFDCEQYSNAFFELCKSKGIPAWVVAYGNDDTNVGHALNVVAVTRNGVRTFLVVEPQLPRPLENPVAAWTQAAGDPEIPEDVLRKMAMHIFKPYNPGATNWVMFSGACAVQSRSDILANACLIQHQGPDYLDSGYSKCLECCKEKSEGWVDDQGWELNCQKNCAVPFLVNYSPRPPQDFTGATPPRRGTIAGQCPANFYPVEDINGISRCVHVLDGFPSLHSLADDCDGDGVVDVITATPQGSTRQIITHINGWGDSYLAGIRVFVGGRAYNCVDSNGDGSFHIRDSSGWDHLLDVAGHNIRAPHLSRSEPECSTREIPLPYQCTDEGLAERRATLRTGHVLPTVCNGGACTGLPVIESDVPGLFGRIHCDDSSSARCSDIFNRGENSWVTLSLGRIREGLNLVHTGWKVNGEIVSSSSGPMEVNILGDVEVLAMFETDLTDLPVIEVRRGGDLSAGTATLVHVLGGTGGILSQEVVWGTDEIITRYTVRHGQYDVLAETALISTPGEIQINIGGNCIAEDDTGGTSRRCTVNTFGRAESTVLVSFIRRDVSTTVETNLLDEQITETFKRVIDWLTIQNW